MSPKTAVPENSAEPGCHHVPWHRHWYLSFVSPLRETWGARGGIGTSPALPLDPPAPLHLPCTFLPVGSLGRHPVPARVGEEEEEGHIQSLGWARAQQRAPHPSRGSAHCHHRSVPPASPHGMGAGCPAGPIPLSPPRGAHGQEPGAGQAAVPAPGLLLPAPTCSDSHQVMHPRLPALVLRRSQALPGRGRESHSHERTKLLPTQLFLLLFLSLRAQGQGVRQLPHTSGDAPSPHGRDGLAAALAGSGRRPQRQLWQSLARTNSNQVSGERLDGNASPTPAQALLKDIATHPCRGCWSRGD